MSARLTNHFFNAKILLFGEHIVNKGAMALAVPIDVHGGVMRYGEIKDSTVKQSNRVLTILANYIIHHEQLQDCYDTNRLLEDIERGLFFDSDIPQGYGLGSSGALVAAVYYFYRKFRKSKTPAQTLKEELALLENHFHGKSSGLDALVSYLNKAVLIHQGDVKDVFTVSKATSPSVTFFVVNTHQPRNTSTYVNHFLDKCKDARFLQTVQNSLIPVSDSAIHALLEGDYSRLISSVSLLSNLQFEFMSEFIPAKFKDVWQSGIKSKTYSLKICGAGGGGYIIGVCRADIDIQQALKGYSVKTILQV